MKCPQCSHEWKWSKGGQARASKLSSERRKEISRKAASKRWSKKPTVQELEQSMEQRLPDTRVGKIGKCISCQKKDVLLSPVVIHGMKAFLCSECAAKS